jgi:UDP-2-acetamido-2,6-beta-L-arabino-hexul-4-ose reductase
VTLANCNILVTGANGFIGKNLTVHLNELADITVSTFVRGEDAAHLSKLVAEADAVVHLAGENRPVNEVAFAQVNTGLTFTLCNAIQQKFDITGQHTPLILTSSIQAEWDNSYGRSKLEAEQVVQVLAQRTGNPCVVFRLPGVFGKWCKPNYNSVVATFCHNLAHDLPIQIQEPSLRVHLVYVDDVVTALLNALEKPLPGYAQAIAGPEYSITLGELAELLPTVVPR